MNRKILGVDLGTNSIGLSLRNPEKGNTLEEQLEYFGVTRFQEGVGNGKSGEFSYAAERTKHRSTRRLYQARKYRLWATLKLLIEQGYCPLSQEDLEKWSRYDKEKGLKRQYPINATEFEQWIRLDFNGDGNPDYTSPFQLRAELMEKQFDFSNQTDRYKLGRALYHIAQRRGFKSSKGETMKEQLSEDYGESSEEIEISAALKKSEEKKSKDLVSYMNENGLPTVGCAFYDLEKKGTRIRNSIYQAVRSQYKEEISKIFDFQNGLDKNSDFYKRIISEKKGEGTIFFKRPLRSQKGLVGKCTLEPQKSRCPISHPEFEKFRAWCFINNIYFRNTSDDDWKCLTIEQKNRLFNEKFMRLKSNFKFSEIREWLEKELHHDFSNKEKTINYKDNTSVSGCPISARLKNILGENWETAEIKTDKGHVNLRTGEVHKVSYSAEDLWHICFSFEEPEDIEEFAVRDLKYDEKQVKQLVLLFGNIQQGYSMLSLKAIRNINRFLQRGLIYTDAVLLAKLPELFGDKWDENEPNVIERIDGIIKNNRKTKFLYNVVNGLIANYKSLPIEEQFAYKNTEYKLTDNDRNDVEQSLTDNFGEKTWKSKSEDEKKNIREQICELYQQFFNSSKREYYSSPKLADSLADFLRESYDFLDNKKLKSIYHPSMIDYYTPAKDEMTEDGRLMKLLGSPVIGALKNPMAMRMLHTLRKQINDLLTSVDADGNALIDENTRIVVETAREMNDANMRWAIKTYQTEREEKNKAFEDAIKRYHPERSYSEADIDNVRLMLEQHSDSTNDDDKKKKRDNGKNNVENYEKVKKAEIAKYRLWLEQGCRCIYTNKPINITNLFSDNAFDFEHTIPRSISFDNSMANITICDAYYNRFIKKNQIPTQLPNYEKDVTIDGVTYPAIKPRLQQWIDKVERLKDNVEFWIGQSKRAQDKDRKDHCIRQKHLWQMELEYWQNKLSRFTMTEVKEGFRNRQLVDTRIISKYAFHYLKTVFNRVDVQKGSVTADFRKILGLQSVDEKKDRGKHSHHAIDATMLTLIPPAAQRDKIIELFYILEEERKRNGNSSKWDSLNNQLSIEIKKCGIDGATDIGKFIEDNILINHISKDKALTPAHRRKRIRGKVVWKRDENGNIICDENGNKIPKQWITGDCIRGRLHGDTFYGAITQWERDKNGNLCKNDDGSIKIEDRTYYVVRRKLQFKKNDNDSGFKNWDDLEECIVNKSLIKKMKSQFLEGTSFKDACAEGIFMLDSNGNKVNRIRHVRCFTSIKNPLPIKKHTYLSSKSYKQNYYAEMGDLYVMCKYQSEDLSETEYVIYSLFDISENRKHNLKDIPNSIENKKRNNRLLLQLVIKNGDMLLLYKDNTDELKEMDIQNLSNRLYVVRGFENDGKRIILQKHINSQPENVLGKGESIKSFESMPEKIRCSIRTLNFLTCGTDFELTPAGIRFMV